ncbi:hypothetical protein B0H19DRAFT_1277764 [Mycena capillaripes]|nr:hypothetical protein B0H19DRAFT_1277764 [Mycena capillaripes]
MAVASLSKARVEEPTENLVTVTVTVEDLKAKSAKAADGEDVYTSYIKAAHGRYTLPCGIVAVLGMQGCQISKLLYAGLVAGQPLGGIISVFGKDTDTTSAPDVFLLEILDLLLSAIDDSPSKALRLSALVMPNMSSAIMLLTVLENYFSEQKRANVRTVTVIAATTIAFGYNYFASFYRASS